MDKRLFPDSQLYCEGVLCLMTTCLMNYSIFKRTILID